MLNIDQIKEILEENCVVHDSQWEEGVSYSYYEQTYWFSKYTYIKIYEDDSYIEEPDGKTDYYLTTPYQAIQLTGYELQLIVRNLDLFKILVNTDSRDLYYKFLDMVKILERRL